MPDLSKPPCDCVFATAVVSPRGDLAVLYFARTQWHHTPLDLLDWSVEGFDAGSWGAIGVRLKELAIEYRARFGSIGVWVESDVLLAAAQASDVAVRLIPKALTTTAVWHELSLAAMVQMRSGNVGATYHAVEKSRMVDETRKFGALKLEGGDRGDDATVPAMLYGIALGLDLALARFARRAAA